MKCLFAIFLAAISFACGRNSDSSTSSDITSATIILTRVSREASLTGIVRYMSKDWSQSENIDAVVLQHSGPLELQLEFNAPVAIGSMENIVVGVRTWAIGQQIPAAGNYSFHTIEKDNEWSLPWPDREAFVEASFDVGAGRVDPEDVPQTMTVTFSVSSEE